MRNRVILSRTSGRELTEYLEAKGLDIEYFEPLTNVAAPVRDHPDLVFCPLRDDMLFEGDRTLLGEDYPEDVRYNGFSTGKYFIHNLRYTDPILLDKVKELGLIPIDVRQGYCNCSIVPVDEDSLITYDKGIASACEAEGLNVLLVESGHVELPGYSTGFIGGASGRIGKELIFNGDITGHPDHERIMDFAEKRGLVVKCFTGYPLRDIGSIIYQGD